MASVGIRGSGAKAVQGGAPLQKEICAVCYMAQKRNAQDGSKCQHLHPTLGVHDFTPIALPEPKGFQLAKRQVEYTAVSVTKSDRRVVETYAQQEGCRDDLEARAFAYLRS